MATLKLQQKKSFSEQNMRKIINLIIGLQSSVNEASTQCLRDYIDDGSRTYSKGEICIFDGYVWECKSVTNGAFNPNSWVKLSDEFTQLEKSDIEAMINLSPEEISKLSDILLDTEVRLDKGWSSSCIYSKLQQCLEDSKTYTLKEINKLSGASYKVVASTSEMTSESIIYLLPNATNYDMYIVEVDGTPTKIGNMDVDLSQYLTKTEIETDYLKKTEADGKYATITTVDGKVDKTSIITAKNNSATDDQVYSAKAINTELDGVVKKTDISTTIDSTSTDDTVPSTKAVNDKFDTLNNRIQPNSVMFRKEDTSYSTLNELIQNHEFFKSSTAEEFIFGAEGFDDLPVTNWGFSIRLYTGAGNKHIIAYKMLSNDLFYTRSMRYDGTWLSDWKRVCTTSVADGQVLLWEGEATSETTVTFNEPISNYPNAKRLILVLWHAAYNETVFLEIPKFLWDRNTNLGVSSKVNNNEVTINIIPFVDLTDTTIKISISNSLFTFNQVYLEE